MKCVFCLVKFFIIAVLFSMPFSMVNAGDLQNNADKVEVASLLKNMAHALRGLNYHGRFVYERNNGDDKNGFAMTTYEVVHVLDDGMEYERVLKVDGEKSEIIREGKPMDCYQPGELILQGNLPENLVKKLGRLQDNYDFSVEGGARVAMRDAWRLSVTPKDDYRLSYQFVIDKENFMLLQGQLLSDEKILEQFHFVQLTFSDIDRNLLNPVTENYKTVMAGECMKDDHSTIVDDAPWRVNLPNGYMFCVYEKLSAGKDSMVYTDGLSTFSVFVNQGYELGDAINSDSYREGSTLMYSHHVNLKSQPYTITVVGEIPEATAKKVVGSLRHRDSLSQ